MPASLTVVGNTNDAIAAIAKMERQYDSLENKVKRLGTSTKQAADMGGTGFEAMAQGAMNFSGRLTGITSGIDLLIKGIGLAKAEWDDFVERQEKALDANKNFAKNLTRLSLATDAPLDQTKAMMLRLSKDNQVDLQDIPSMINRYQAAKGPTQTMADVEKMFVAAARIGKFDPESMGMLGETGLDITKQVPGTTAEQALGFSLAAQSLSRVADPMAFNKNVIPAALGGYKISGTSLETGIALSNALTHGSGDDSGRRAATAQISLEMQMKEAFPELKDAAERIKYMQDNPDIREGFLQGLKNELTGPGGEKLSLEGYSGERRMQPAIQALLTKGTAEATIYEETLRTLIPLAGGQKEYQRRAGEISKDSNMQAVEFDRALQGDAERRKIADTESAKEAAARLGIDANLSAAGVGYVDRTILGWQKFGRRALGQDESEAGLNTLSAEIARTESQLGNWRGSKEGREASEKYLSSLRGVRETMSFGRPNGRDAPPGDAVEDIPYTPWKPKDELGGMTPEQLRGAGYNAERARMEARQSGDKEEMELQNGILRRIETVMREKNFSRNGQVEN